MPTLAQAIASMNPLFDQLVIARGRDVPFRPQGGGAVFDVRVVESTNWTPTDSAAGEFIEQDFDVICRDDELVAAGVSRAPRRPDAFVIDGVQRAVESATPLHVGGQLFGYRVLLSG